MSVSRRRGGRRAMCANQASRRRRWRRVPNASSRANALSRGFEARIRAPAPGRAEGAAVPEHVDEHGMGGPPRRLAQGAVRSPAVHRGPGPRRAPGARRRPRTNSAADMRRPPGGWSSVMLTAPGGAAAITSPASSHRSTVPGARAGSPSASLTRQTLNAGASSPARDVCATGHGSNARTARSISVAGSVQSIAACDLTILGAEVAHASSCGRDSAAPAANAARVSRRAAAPSSARRRVSDPAVSCAAIGQARAARTGPVWRPSA